MANGLGGALSSIGKTLFPGVKRGQQIQELRQASIATQQQQTIQLGLKNAWEANDPEVLYQAMEGSGMGKIAKSMRAMGGVDLSNLDKLFGARSGNSLTATLMESGHLTGEDAAVKTLSGEQDPATYAGIAKSWFDQADKETNPTRKKASLDRAERYQGIADKLLTRVENSVGIGSGALGGLTQEQVSPPGTLQDPPAGFTGPLQPARNPFAAAPPAPDVEPQPQEPLPIAAPPSQKQSTPTVENLRTRFNRVIKGAGPNVKKDAEEAIYLMLRHKMFPPEMQKAVEDALVRGVSEEDIFKSDEVRAMFEKK